MATKPPQKPETATKSALRPEIDRIIKSGKQVPSLNGSAWPIAIAGLFSGLLLWLSFTPVDFGPVAWIAILPLSVLLRFRQLPKFSYRALMLSGFIWAVATLQWMRLGHVAMYGAVVALSFYLAFYFPVFVAVGRCLVRAGFPIWLAVPVVWTTLEYLRAHLMTGFSWYYLGHTQYQWTILVQISDITGAYGVSFLVAMSSGVLAAVVPETFLARLNFIVEGNSLLALSKGRQYAGVATLLSLLVVSCLYGLIRASDLTETGEGPVVAVVQGNFSPEVKHDPSQALKLVREHDLLTRRVAGFRPDLIVWPETMFPARVRVIANDVTDEQLADMIPPAAAMNSEQVKMEIESWRSGYARELLTNRSQEAGAAMLVGLIAETADVDKTSRFNSAAFIRPDIGYVGRYDKIHRVIFGEYIPLKSVLPWLSKATPFSAGFGIDAGSESNVFEYAGTRFAPIICFEDTVPHLVRSAVLTEDSDGRQPDVLINMTNDGWFRGSSELDQHLITATFRCIETRRPMVRAVNGGISAFIDSSGRIRQPEHFRIMNEQTAGVAAEWSSPDSLINPKTGRRYRQCSAVMCGQVPLDGRQTVYLQFGDWFAFFCGGLTIAGLFMGRIRSKASRAAGVTKPDTSAEPVSLTNAA